MRFAAHITEDNAIAFVGGSKSLAEAGAYLPKRKKPHNATVERSKWSAGALVTGLRNMNGRSLGVAVRAGFAGLEGAAINAPVSAINTLDRRLNAHGERELSNRVRALYYTGYVDLSGVKSAIANPARWDVDQKIIDDIQARVRKEAMPPVVGLAEDFQQHLERFVGRLLNDMHVGVDEEGLGIQIGTGWLNDIPPIPDDHPALQSLVHAVVKRVCKKTGLCVAETSYHPYIEFADSMSDDPLADLVRVNEAATTLGDHDYVHSVFDEADPMQQLFEEFGEEEGIEMLEAAADRQSWHSLDRQTSELFGDNPDISLCDARHCNATDRQHPAHKRVRDVLPLIESLTKNERPNDEGGCGLASALVVSYEGTCGRKVAESANSSIMEGGEPAGLYYNGPNAVETMIAEVRSIALGYGLCGWIADWPNAV